MSRIEEALERAARMQKNTETRETAPAGQAPLSAPAAFPPPGMDGMDGAGVGDRIGTDYGPMSKGRKSYPRNMPVDTTLPGAANPMLATLSDPLSPVAEEYRKLKESLVKRTKKNGFRNTIMVTSATMGEGKSVTSANLAISLAQEFDHTVLLIDADLRRPSLHRLFGLNPEIGLSDCLVEGRDVSEAFIRTGIGRLVFLPAGKPMPNPGELFSSTMMRNIILEMKHRYSDRYVIIDTPPVLPFAETRSLSHSVDGAIVVVKEGQVPLRSVEETVHALRETELLGYVFNQATATADTKYHYYYNYQ